MGLHLIHHELRRRHAGTVLGFAWAVLQPVMILGAFFFLFTVLRVVHRFPHGALGAVGVILSGLITWLYVIRSSVHSLSTLDEYSPLVKQINFPIGILPFVIVGVNLFDFLIGLVILLSLSAWQGWIGLDGLLIIPTTLVMTVFLVGLGGLLAPLGVIVRDLKTVAPVVERLGLWISPILYLPGAVPTRFGWVMQINPLAYFAGLVRRSAFGASFGHAITPLPTLSTLAIAGGVSLLLAIGGYWSWRHVRRIAVDYL